MQKTIVHYGTGCKDVFHAYMVKHARFDGELEIPCVKTTDILPMRLVPFSHAKSEKDHTGFVVFYEHDEKIEPFWNDPKRYLSVLKQFDGVITPDYSLYYDMPLVMQEWNTYRGRAVGAWLNDNGIPTIPNVRWGDERTYELACLGVECNSTIAVGTHGCIKSQEYKHMFIKGFDYILNKLQPKNVVVYGSAPSRIFCLAEMYGVSIMQYESYFSLSHKKEVG